MSIAATRRSSMVGTSAWATLPLKPAATMAEAVHNQAARELLRNAPEVFTDGCLAGLAPQFTWEDLYSETEVAIIKEGVKLRNFNEFLTVMMELFPPSESATLEEKNLHKKKVLMKTIDLWHMVCSLNEKDEL